MAISWSPFKRSGGDACSEGDYQSCDYTLASIIDEGIAEEPRLALECLSRVPRVLHEGDLLGQEPGQVHGVGLRFLGLSLVERVIPVYVDHRPLAEALRAIFTEVVEAARNSRLAKLEPPDDGIWCEPLHCGCFLSLFRLRHDWSLLVRPRPNRALADGSAWRGCGSRSADSSGFADRDRSEWRKVRISGQRPGDPLEGLVQCRSEEHTSELQ